MVRQREQISAESKAVAVVLRRSCGKLLSYRRIAKKCNTSKSQGHCSCTNAGKTRTGGDHAANKGGRPRKLDQRGIQALIRTVKELPRKNVNFTIKQLAQASRISQLVSRRTISCYLNQRGCRFLQMRKKGLLSAKDRLLRLQFARRMK